MCFSATASFVAGSLLVGTGLTTLSMSKSRRELPLASVPLLFGVQQISEGFVWKGNVGAASSPLDAAGYVFLIFALLVWPTYMPLVALAIEPMRLRRWLIGGMAIVGVGTSTYLGFGLTTHTVFMHTQGQRIVYDVHGFNASAAQLWYLAAATVSCLLSSRRVLQVFGVLSIVLGEIANAINTRAFVSVWCFFAAILSVVLVTHFARGVRPAWRMGTLGRG